MARDQGRPINHVIYEHAERARLGDTEGEPSWIPRRSIDLVAAARRRTLRLLAGGLLGGVLAGRWVAPAAAQFADDRDSDGLLDADESAIYGTNPGAYDSDGDGLNDGEEIYYGTNPLVADANTIQVDSDEDGLQDADENTIYGTQRLNYDTDGDGVGDGEEVYLGTNPLVAPPPANGDAVAIGDANSGGNADGAIGVGDTGDVICRGIGCTCE